MSITSKQYKKINNSKEYDLAFNRLKLYFNLYIRLRDFNREGQFGETLDTEQGINRARGVSNTYERITAKCIACGKTLNLELFSDKSIMNGREMAASHFFNTDVYASVEFYEDNVHLSCARCNSPYGLHGNKEHYQTNLVKKIGDARFEQLIFEKNKIKKYNILELDVLAKEYRDKAKQRAKELGVKI